MEMLMAHNQRTLEQLERYTDKGKDCCVVNPCGSGKTSVMAAFIKRHPGKKFVVFTKQKNAKGYYEKKDNVFLSSSVKVFTYNRMRCDYKARHTAEYSADYYLVDEAHYLGARKWGEAFDFLRKTYAPVVIGFTATVQRFEDQGTDNTIVETLFSGNSAGNYSTRQLQEYGVFKEPEYILSLYDMRSTIEEQLEKLAMADISDKVRARFEERLKDALDEWNKNSNPEKVLKEALPRYMYKEKSNRILVYVSRVSEIDSKVKALEPILKSIFKGQETTSYRYTYAEPESNLQEFLKEDDSYIKILYSVDKIMETVHIDDLNIAIMLRPSVSNRIITQQFGRLNSIGNDKKPLIIDMVDNLSNLGSISFANTGMGQSVSHRDGNTVSLNLKYVSRYKGLFDAIDQVAVKNSRYEYNGFVGSLSQLCTIYGKDYGEIKELIGNGATLEEAFERASLCNKQNMSQEIFDGIPKNKEFTLTTEQKIVAEKYIPTVERFIKARNISDEDMIQELYMEMMYQVSRADDLNGYLSAHIVNSMNVKYARMYKAKVMRDKCYEDRGVHQLTIPVKDDMAKEIFSSDVTNDLKNVLLTLTEREQKIIDYRFGLTDGTARTLEEIGRMFGVTRDRIRQIEAKALKKLRAPSRCGGSGSVFRELLEICNEVG